MFYPLLFALRKFMMRLRYERSLLVYLFLSPSLPLPRSPAHVDVEIRRLGYADTGEFSGARQGNLSLSHSVLPSSSVETRPFLNRARTVCLFKFPTHVKLSPLISSSSSSIAHDVVLPPPAGFARASRPARVHRPIFHGALRRAGLLCSITGQNYKETSRAKSM